MCFHSQQHKSPQEIAKRFSFSIDDVPENVTGTYNGFEFPKTPVITNNLPNKVQLFNWGLIPYWAKNQDFRKFTLNAKIETLRQKPSFKDVVSQRCLILADGFNEWQWQDPKGKVKQKYLLNLPDNELFTYAGIWSKWTNPLTGQPYHSYTIITTEANELMQKIHNTKKRMPVVIPPQFEQDWLNQMPVEEASHFSVDLCATKV